MPQELEVAVLCRLMAMHVKDALYAAQLTWTDVGNLTGWLACLLAKSRVAVACGDACDHQEAAL